MNTGTCATVDDPNAAAFGDTPAVTTINGINDLGRIIGFKQDANGNVAYGSPGGIGNIAWTTSSRATQAART